MLHQVCRPAKMSHKDDPRPTWEETGFLHFESPRHQMRWMCVEVMDVALLWEWKVPRLEFDIQLLAAGLLPKIAYVQIVWQNVQGGGWVDTRSLWIQLLWSSLQLLERDALQGGGCEQEWRKNNRNENYRVFFNWYPPKKYGKPRLGVSTLT